MRTYSGEAASLGAALTWASSTALYERHGQQVSVADLNFMRTTISAIAFLALKQLDGGAWPDPTTCALLALSGLLTFGLSDLLFFVALGRLGGQATAVPQCSVPVVVAALAWFMWREALTGLQILGLSLTLGAVTASIIRPYFRPVCNGVGEPSVSRADITGSICAGLSALLQAVGVLILKKALVGVNVVAAMTIRVGPAAAVMAAWRVCNHHRRPLPTGRQLSWLTGAILLGTVAGALLQSYGLQRAPAGICTVLTATYPLWLIPISFVSGNAVDRSTIPPAVIALAGVCTMCA